MSGARHIDLGFDPDAPLAEQAHQWLLILASDACTPEVHDAFNDWLNASDEHGPALAAAQALLRDLDQADVLREAPALAATRRRADSRPAARKSVKPVPRRALAAVGGLLAACVAAAVFLWPSPTGEQVTAQAPQPAPQIFRTAIGEIATVNLADGTRVTLGADTQIAFAATPGDRQVELARGEALFDVTHDAAKPFRVEAGPATATVLGTSFNMRKGAHGVTVSVLQGRVAVAPMGDTNEAAIVLRRGEQVSVDALAGLQSARSFDESQVLGWRQRQLSYDNAPLDELVMDLNRYSGVPVALADPSIGAMTVTASFDISQRDSILEGLAEALSLNVVRSKDKVLLARR